ncbi:MAG: hypothetical protein ABIG37_01300, partial [Nanoarchaeota archaeon]
FFMFLSFYFFLASWKSEKLKNGVIFAFLAGLSTALMGLVWGAWIYVFVVIAIFVFFNFIFNNITKNNFFVYSIWFFTSMIIVYLFTQRYTLNKLATSHSSIISLSVLLLISANYLIFSTKIKNTKFIEKLRKKIPDKFISIFLTVILGVIFSSMIFGISFVPEFIKETIEQLTIPYTDRLSFTIFENRQPYFEEWTNSFGPIIKGIPLFFGLFFIGSIFLFYGIIKKLNKKAKLLLTGSYILFLFGLIFSRYSQNSIMSGDNFLCKLVYFGSFFIMFLSWSYVYYWHYKEIKLNELKKINFSYLFLLIFFLISLIGARSAIRLIMVLAPSTAGIVSYFLISIVEKARIKKQDETLRLFLMIFAIILLIAFLYSFYFNFQASLENAKNMAPSIYNYQWQKAMLWVRENTPENAVFSHWWDYGYWIQTIGNRATILDGGNVIGYWNHLFGRHVLTGETKQEALEFLYTHNASHLLIDSTEIKKYGAYSRIGSDENYDRYSWLGTFILDEEKVDEEKNEMIYIGDFTLDEDYIFESENKKIFLASEKSVIRAFFLRINNEKELEQPTAVFVYQEKQIEVKIRYIYYQEKLYDFKEGYKGCLYILPKLIKENGEFKLNEEGAALFLSEKTINSLFVKLYLFDENMENFKLVHKEDNLAIGDLRTQGFSGGDFVFYNGILGPIKIWEINYPENIEFKKEYLNTEYPESLQIA